MPSREIDSKNRYEISYPLLNITSNGTIVGNPIDLQDVNSVQLTIQSGTITDGVHNFSLEESVDAGFSVPIAVPDSDLRGAVTADLEFGSADDQVSKDVGYVGNKRFVRWTLTSSGVTTGGFFSGMLIKSDLSLAPNV